MKIKLLVSSILFFSLCTNYVQAQDEVLDTAKAIQLNQKKYDEILENLKKNKLKVPDTYKLSESDQAMFKGLDERIKNGFKDLKTKKKNELSKNEQRLLQHQYSKNDLLKARDKILAESKKDTFKDLQANTSDKVRNKLKLEQYQKGFMGNADVSKAQYDTLIFMSFSMPQNTIVDMLKDNAGAESTTIVIRGLPKECHSITDAIRKIHKMVKDLKLEKVPNVIINPVLFSEYHISSVPQVVYLESKTPNQTGDPNTNKVKPQPKMIAKVKGMTTPTWLKRQVKEGKKGDLGVQGPVYEIEERDLIAEMQDRASQIDWKAKKDGAVKRAWMNLNVPRTYKADKYRIRQIDPTFTLSQDIKNVEGKVVAAKGTTINPLTLREFNRLMVVFDGTDPKEIDFVYQSLNKWTGQHKIKKENVRLILSEIDRENGTKEHEKLNNTFNTQVYMLNLDITRSFKVEKHPSIVYQEGDHFVVEEFKVE